MNINVIDSAEYYFRKELRDGRDFNNQNAGAKGLAELYQILHQSDSVAKYYQYAYAMNDSMHAHRATETVERMQAMYNYSRNQEIALQESEKAMLANRRLLLSMFFILAMTLLASWLYFARKEIKKKSIAVNIQYSNLLSRYQQAQQDMLP